MPRGPEGGVAGPPVIDPQNPGTLDAQTTYLDWGFYFCDGLYSGPEAPQGLGVFKSSDGGATWPKLDLPGGLGSVPLLGIDQQGTIYVRSQAGFVRSQDGGATWNAVPTAGLLSGVGMLAFDPQDPNHLFTGTGAGVFEVTLAPAQQ